MSHRSNQHTQALEYIRDQLGGVCDTYEICTHAACRSSATAQFAATAALDGSWNGFIADQKGDPLCNDCGFHRSWDFYHDPNHPQGYGHQFKAQQQ